MTATIPPEGAINGVWLRAPSSSGGKDWIGYQTPLGVVARWGKTSQVNQSKFTKGGHLQKIVSQKLKKGYAHVGVWSPRTDWTRDLNSSKDIPIPQNTKQETINKTNSAVEEWNSAPDAVEWF